MDIIVIFGLPGAGKTYTGKVFEKNFNYHLYEADQSLPENMKQALQKNEKITTGMRDAFFNRILKTSKILEKKHPKLVITQTFIKEKYRKLFLQHVPEARFILVETKIELRENRLKKRKYFPINLEYAREMVQNFDTPQIPFKVIENDIEGEENIKQQIQLYLQTTN